MKRVGIGIALYALFVYAVIEFYPDTPENMDWEDRQEFNQVQISKIELGQTKHAVLTLLGSPDITEAKRLNGSILQVMFYRTHHLTADGITTEDECTPMLFENDILIAKGSHAYQSFKQNQ